MKWLIVILICGGFISLSKPVIGKTSPIRVTLQPLSLSTSQMDNIVVALQKYIASKNLPSSFGIQPIENYAIQFGLLSEKDKKMIHVNAFCQLYGGDLKAITKTWVRNADGGGCFFSVNYNLESHALSCLHINAGHTMPYEDSNCDLEKKSSMNEKAKP